MPSESCRRQSFPGDRRVTSRPDAAETSKANVEGKPLAQRAEEYYYVQLTRISRLVTVVAIIFVIAYAYRNTIQVDLDKLWFSIRNKSWFQNAHFESLYVTFVYTLLMVLYPYTIHHIPYLGRFKVSSEVTYVHQTVSSMTKELIYHITPLLVADMLIIKRYPDVPYSEIAIQKKSWIVTTRPLPESSPNFMVLCFHVIGSLIMFDFLFTIIHYAMHHNMFLYKYFHSQHHTHEVVHAHITNQLSIVERALQVISANYALKAFGSHPITRLVFVPVFLWLLIENHTGYDLPWGPHRILPEGIMGGPAKHYSHHIRGHGNYQPFFSYLDNFLERKNKLRKS